MVQVGASPTMPSHLGPGFAAAIKGHVEIEKTVTGRNQSTRRASFYCSLQALSAVSSAMAIINRIVDYFDSDDEQRALLCEAGSLKGVAKLTDSTIAMWALEQPAGLRRAGDAGGGGGSRRELVRAQFELELRCCYHVRSYA